MSDDFLFRLPVKPTKKRWSTIHAVGLTVTFSAKKPAGLILEIKHPQRVPQSQFCSVMIWSCDAPVTL